MASRNSDRRTDPAPQSSTAPKRTPSESRYDRVQSRLSQGPNAHVKRATGWHWSEVGVGALLLAACGLAAGWVGIATGVGLILSWLILPAPFVFALGHVAVLGFDSSLLPAFTRISVFLEVALLGVLVSPSAHLAHARQLQIGSLAVISSLLLGLEVLLWDGYPSETLAWLLIGSGVALGLIAMLSTRTHPDQRNGASPMELSQSPTESESTGEATPTTRGQAE